MIAFDIGCNEGIITQDFLKNYDLVVSVDADSAMCNMVKRKYECNKLRVHNNIVSDSVGEMLDFYISPMNTISTVEKKWIKEGRFAGKYIWNETIKVETITLDKLIQMYGIPDIIKIDVEGHELKVLKGLGKPVKKIYFEWSEEFFDDTLKCVEHLKNIGFSKFGFTYADRGNPEVYGKWENLTIHEDIVTDRKVKWGNIWAV
jgi:FkbM family methyltransferase